MSDPKLEAWRAAVKEWEALPPWEQAYQRDRSPRFPTYSNEEIEQMPLQHLEEVYEAAKGSALITDSIFLTAAYCARRFK